MERVLDLWGLPDPIAITPTALGSGRTWTVDAAAGRYLLKAVNPAQAERERGILRELAELGLPVAPPIPTADGAWFVDDVDGRRYCLYARLPGESASAYYHGPEADVWPGRLGRALALLHAGLRACHDPSPTTDPEIIAQVRAWAIPRIRESDGLVDAGAIEAAWHDVEGELDALWADLPRQLIHRDPHPGNMLFADDRLTGWLDLEQVRQGPRLFDVCYCAGSILVEGFEAPARAERWAGIFRALVAGYEERLPLTDVERRATYGMFVAIELIFIASYLGWGLPDAARVSARLLDWLVVRRTAATLQCEAD